ncbi:MAG: tRNA pseudouridine(55) synthase TruB [Propionibacteriaceae bacterium]|nr:tRNA pseudouridine(55) synthase TruB [Propionibacteriaceae bacterium]
MSQPDITPNGIVVVDKPSGLTSQAVVSRVKRALGIKKVGHAGTLDPMATGVLVIGVGRATRLLGFLAGHDKRYLATIRLGVATTTDDAEGTWLGEPVDVSGIDEGQVRAAIAAYVGDISQVPSAVSAIKVDGKRAYALVRAGEQVELKSRDVTVSKYDLLDVRRVSFAKSTVPTDAGLSACSVGADAPVETAPAPSQPSITPSTRGFLDLDVDVECSSGTYIRALARDLGRDLGVGGHLTSLRRLRVGAFGIEQSCQLDEASLADLIPMGVAAKQAFPWVQVDAATAQEIHYGRKVQLSITHNPTALLDPDGDLLALYQPGDPARPIAVFVS